MPTIVHFDVPADDLTRARKFYSELFGWNFIAPPGFPDYYLIETNGLDGRPATGGGMGKRGDPAQRMMNYIGIPEINEYVSRVKQLGGSVVLPRSTVPGFGYLAICTDTEGNPFGLWQDDPLAAQHQGQMMEGGTATARVLASKQQEKDLLILGIHGSPRGVKSRTRMLVQWVLAGAEDTGADSELFDLSSLRIEACNACEGCSLTGQCVYDDDFVPLYERMIAADGIVLGSPVYVDNVTAQMKVFIDRLADAIHYQTLSGKYGCAVATTWSSGGENVVFYLNHVLNYLGILTLEGISVAIGNAHEAIYREEEKARKLGERLAGAISMQEKYPGQTRIIEANRSFFARIVEQNREWRPDEYREWVRKGWIN